MPTDDTVSPIRAHERSPHSLPRDRPLEIEPRVWAALLGLPALAASQAQFLSQIAQPRPMTPGQVLFTHHDPAKSLVFVREGQVALGHQDAGATFRVARPVVGPGWLDASAAWLGGCHAVDARAMSAGTVVELPLAQLRATLELHPELARRLIVALARETELLRRKTGTLMRMDAPARLALWLTERLEGTPPQAVVHLHERKRDIASQLAITPETFSRLLRSLVRRGVVSVAGYTVQVLDPVALRQLAEEG
jgi:CRP-like cAMP-binding protein